MRNFIYLDIDLTLEKFEMNTLLEVLKVVYGCSFFFNSAKNSVILQNIIQDHSGNLKVLIQACYVICNLAAGTEALKNAIVFQTSIPKNLYDFLECNQILASVPSPNINSLSDSDDDILDQKQESPSVLLSSTASHLSSTLEEDLQIAAIWCLLNLAWQFDIGMKLR